MPLFSLIDVIKIAFTCLFTYFFDSTVQLLPRMRLSRNSLKKILVVRLDSIGDFIVWLDAAKELRRIYPPETNHITLLASVEWSDFAKSFNYWDEIVSVDRKKFTKILKYRWLILRNVYLTNYEIVLHPVFSRILNLGDAVVMASAARVRIGWDLYQDLNSPFFCSLKKFMVKSWYTQLVSLDRSRIMEFEKNAQFLKALGLNDFHSEIPRLPKINLGFNQEINGKYIVIATDAQWEGREWPLDRYIAIARKIHALNMGWIIVFLGTSKSKAQVLSTALSNFPVNSVNLNLIGETSFMSYVSLIANAKFVLANESSAIHIAAAAGVSSLAIAGGGHWGRFIPYHCEQGMERAPFIVNTFLDCYKCEWQCKFSRNQGDPVKCIEIINEDQVWIEVERILKFSATNN